MSLPVCVPAVCAQAELSRAPARAMKRTPPAGHSPRQPAAGEFLRNSQQYRVRRQAFVARYFTQKTAALCVAPGFRETWRRLGNPPITASSLARDRRWVQNDGHNSQAPQRRPRSRRLTTRSMRKNREEGAEKWDSKTRELRIGRGLGSTTPPIPSRRSPRLLRIGRGLGSTTPPSRWPIRLRPLRIGRGLGSTTPRHLHDSANLLLRIGRGLGSTTPRLGRGRSVVVLRIGRGLGSTTPADTAPRNTAWLRIGRGLGSTTPRTDS